MFQILSFLISVFLLGACSTIPSGPSVLILPGTGKELGQFHNDDWVCREFAHTQISTPKEPDSMEEGQHDYDMSYIQCMYSKGHRVPVPGEFSYNSQKDVHSPPPPNLPAPPQTSKPDSSVSPAQ